MSTIRGDQILSLRPDPYEIKAEVSCTKLSITLWH